MLYPTLWRTQSPNIWDELSSMRSEFDRMLGRREAGVTSAWCPVVDVHESKDELVLHAELPGMRPEHVDVSVENGVLTISGEKKQEVEKGDEDTDYHLIERRYGRFERRFSMPRTVDAEQVDAEFSNGVLRITLPKAEAAKPRKIEIKAKDRKEIKGK
ncbi:MAG: Hsp20/alpha crystallin family protein [Gemmatimonadales bacterium]|jgi:HSP20 family protein